MKRIVFILSLMFVIMSVMASPAKKGIWRTLTLEDGSEVRAMLCGDLAQLAYLPHHVRPEDFQVTPHFG